jgi:hypothetical protein
VRAPCLLAKTSSWGGRSHTQEADTARVEERRPKKEQGRRSRRSAAESSAGSMQRVLWPWAGLRAQCGLMEASLEIRFSAKPVLKPGRRWRRSRFVVAAVHHCLVGREFVLVIPGAGMMMILSPCWTSGGGSRAPRHAGVLPR